MERISKNHDAFKTVRNLIKANGQDNKTVTDDLQILSIINTHNINIDILLYSYEHEYQGTTRELLDQLIKKANTCYEISRASYETIAQKDNHAGIIAVVDIPLYKLEDFNKKQFLFVLDHLEIPGNIGTIYRTLDAVKAEGVLLVDPISKIHNPKLTSAARGCNLIIPTVSSSYNDCLNWLIENNYNIYLGEPTLGLDYQSYDYNGKIAIVVGNERFGINNDWYNHSHNKVYIPMEGNQNSLNVGVAASILAYEAYMKKQKKPIK